ncbi:Cytochrome P450 [Phytophthora cinnamomi]|uniref:Cytochrome P450 n=1 Tax=Phytophthora cinnamomi TaxID=4785 RepID=UPI00355A0FC3|nr:Cytochrome P450 [Phytophthora cinnamomi]
MVRGPHQKNSVKAKAIAASEDAVANDSSLADVAAEYKVTPRTLLRWRKAASAITAAPPSRKFVRSAARRGPPILLLEWVHQMRKNRARCVTSQCLLVMGTRFEPRLLGERTQRAAYEYLRRFRDRNKLSIRRITHRGVKQREELQLVADAFGCAMRYAIEINSVVSITAGDDKYNYVCNMDQTSIYIDMKPSTTISFRGERHVDVVQSMSANSFRASVFLCASATGCKLPPLVVFKGEPGYHVQAELERHPAHRSDKVVLTVQANAYCDQHVMEEWIQECAYIKGKDGKYVYICLYVYDMDIVAKTTAEIEEVKVALKNSFKMKELGEAKFILGKEISHDYSTKTLMIK